jgi:hypothetical protein
MIDTLPPLANNQPMGPHFAQLVAFALLTPTAAVWSQTPHSTAQHSNSQIGRTGHWPTWTPTTPPVKHHPTLGTGYAGYPWLAPFAYSTLPLVYDTSDGEDQPEIPQPPPRVEYGAPPPERYPEQVAESVPTPYRPTYAGREPDPQPATTLVFNDGKPPVQVHNYAVIGDTLYGLDTEARQEIPLADLNLPATIAINRKAGVDFSLPQK